MNIGKQLRQAREARSLSLEQAAQEMRIRARYIEALETEAFEVLPSNAQLRGFLRTYASYLRLDAEPMLRELDQVPDQESAASPAPAPPSEQLEPEQAREIFAEIGGKLRSQREILGLSLEDVELHTRIRMHYLRALERGDLSSLPSPVQGKGMLHNYAHFLGMDTEAMLLRYSDMVQARLAARQNKPSLNQPKTTQPQGPVRPSLLRRLLSPDLLIGAFVVIFLGAFAIWGMMRVSNLRSDQGPTQTAPSISDILLSTPTPELSGTPPSGTQAALATPLAQTTLLPGALPAAETSGTPTETAPAQEVSTAPIQIYIVVEQRAWMRVTVDGEQAYQGRVLPGSAYTFAGESRVDLATGNAAGLHIYFNQQDLGILGAFGEVLQRVFTIQGMQTATPRVPPTSTPAPTLTPTPRETTPPTPTLVP